MSHGRHAIRAPAAFLAFALGTGLLVGALHGPRPGPNSPGRW